MSFPASSARLCSFFFHFPLLFLFRLFFLASAFYSGPLRASPLSLRPPPLPPQSRHLHASSALRFFPAPYFGCVCQLFSFVRGAVAGVPVVIPPLSLPFGLALPSFRFTASSFLLPSRFGSPPRPFARRSSWRPQSFVVCLGFFPPLAVGVPLSSFSPGFFSLVVLSLHRPVNCGFLAISVLVLSRYSVPFCRPFVFSFSLRLRYWPLTILASFLPTAPQPPACSVACLFGHCKQILLSSVCAVPSPLRKFPFARSILSCFPSSPARLFFFGTRIPAVLSFVASPLLRFTSFFLRWCLPLSVPLSLSGVDFFLSFPLFALPVFCPLGFSPLARLFLTSPLALSRSVAIFALKTYTLRSSGLHLDATSVFPPALWYFRWSCLYLVPAPLRLTAPVLCPRFSPSAGRAPPCYVIGLGAPVSNLILGL